MGEDEVALGAVVDVGYLVVVEGAAVAAEVI